MMRRKKKKSNHISESWLLPYSDLLTLLVALFIVLFAMSDINAEKYERLSQVFESEFSSGGIGILDQNKQPNEIPTGQKEDDEDDKNKEKSKTSSELELEKLQGIQGSINTYIQEQHLEGDIGTKLTDEGLLITIVNNVFFDSGSAEVKKDGEKVAREVSNLLVADPPHEIVISGHSDDVPIHNSGYASNWDLSVTRALNFMQIILENEKLDPALFSAKGYGENKPVVPNTSAENREKNRRVEVLILPNYEINITE